MSFFDDLCDAEHDLEGDVQILKQEAVSLRDENTQQKKRN
jgi:hypothetical protein